MTGSPTANRTAGFIPDLGRKRGHHRPLGWVERSGLVSRPRILAAAHQRHSRADHRWCGSMWLACGGAQGTNQGGRAGGQQPVFQS